MRVSLHTIKQFIDFELPSVDELVSRVNAQLGGVDEVINFGDKYNGAKIVRVVECDKHPNADKLSVCKIDAGTDELIQVVCGAPNVHAEMWAIWLPPESTVPATYGDAEPFVLSARELRGEMSNGMLASARELAIGDDHDGIVEIFEHDIPAGKELGVGASFAEVFGLDDYAIDIENKMFTHRPDLFGQLGVAREIAGIFGKQFTSPEWYKSIPEFAPGSGDLQLEVFNDAPGKAPRLMTVVLKSVEVKPSPLWLKCALVAMGGKPINNIVDATNYIMLITAQPTHAYDYDKIRGKRLGVRMAHDGEKLPLLNGKTYELTSDDIVIADNEGAIGLAGIMGGANSEVSPETKNIILEVANFDMYAVRKSSMRHGIFTDALTRFNKGQSPLQNQFVLAKLMELIKGEQASEVFDVECEEAPYWDQVIPSFSADFINQRLGLALSNTEIVTLLQNVEIDVGDNENEVNGLGVRGEGISLEAPFWRADLWLHEDIVEEVGRLYGYDRLPLELPKRSTKPAPVNAGRELAQNVRDLLMRSGANEVLTYSFVHERIIKAAAQNKDDAYGLSNALSPDLQYYRLSLTPSLLDKVHSNIKAGHDEFALFEFGKTHSKGAGLDDEGLPIEQEQLAFVFAGKAAKESASFYQAKTYLEFIAHTLGLTFTYEPLSGESSSPITAPFEPKRSAIVTDKKSGAFIAIVGEYKKTASKNFKLPEFSAGFELSMQALLQVVSEAGQNYLPLSRYPSVERDISLQVDNKLSYSEVFESLKNALQASGLQFNIQPVSIYQPDDATTKNLAFRILFTSYEKTLTSEEVNKAIEAVVHQLEESISASLV